MRFSWLRPLLLSSIVLSLVLAACGSGDGDAPAATATSAPGQPTATPRPTAPPTATSAPVSTGEMRYGLASMGVFELVMAEGNATLYLDSIYDRAMGRNDNGVLDGKEGFSAAWSVSADSLTWTVKTRTDVVFHNGDKATSRDLKGNIDRTMAEGSKRFNTFKRDIKSMATPDDSTFVITYNRRTIFPPQFGNAALLEPNDYITAKGLPEANRTGIGSGVYKFKSLVLDDRITVEAVERHWLWGVPRTKTVIYRLIPEETTRIALLQSGEIEWTNVSRANSATVRNSTNLRLITRDESGITTFRLEGQMIPEYPGIGKNPMADVRVRKALIWYGIDREKLVRTFLQGAGNPTMNYPVTPGEPSYKALPVPAYDLAKAKALLAEAGFANGFEVDLYIWPRPALPEGPQMMEAIAVWWEQLGLKVTRKPSEYAAWRDHLQANASKPTGAYTKPSASGMYFLGNSTQAGTGTGAACTPPFSFFQANRSQSICDLGKIWEDAPNEQEYIIRGQAWMQAKYELAEDPAVTTVGDLFGVGAKMPTKWNPGKDSFSYRLERAAAIRY